MASVAAVVVADSSTTVECNNSDGTNGSQMTDFSHGDGATVSELLDLAAIKAASEARLREMEDEVINLKQMQTEVNKLMSLGNLPEFISPLNIEAIKIEADSKSIYVGNVDYSATIKDLKEHFHECGVIKRASILSHKFNGHPKGFAYVEFINEDSVRTAMTLDESLFKGRQIKVMPKRTNKPGLATTNRQPRGMQGRGRSFRGGFVPFNSGYRPVRSTSTYRRGNFSSPYVVRREPAPATRWLSATS